MAVHEEHWKHPNKGSHITLPSQIPLNNDERVFFITVGILGVCFYSAVVGQMSVLVANMNTVGLRHT